MRRAIAVLPAILAALAVASTAASAEHAMFEPSSLHLAGSAVVTRAPALPTVPAVAVGSESVHTPRTPPAAAPHATPAPPAASKVVAAKTSAAVPRTASVKPTNSRTAYVNTMYAAVVPARQRAALAGRYQLGYNLAGLACGTGCTGLFNGQARTSFDATFFAESRTYQRNRVAYEAAHAYGFLSFTDYTTPSWASIGGWQTQFHDLDRHFARTYDAEAWAACIAWRETGFNNRVDQIINTCTDPAATLAMAQIA